MGFALTSRLRAAALHLLISSAVAGAAAAVVFGVWFPGVFRELADGTDLFLVAALLATVCGPLLTLVLLSRTKSPMRRTCELAFVGVLQSAALAYGIVTVATARPVAMVFEVDRFRLVTARDVPRDELASAPAAYRRLSWSGPLLLGTRRPAAGPERDDALFRGLAGLDIGSRPKFWQPYGDSRAAALARSRPLALIAARHPGLFDKLLGRLTDMKGELASARFLPAMASGDWVAVLNGRGDVMGYLPLDGFF